MNRFEIIKIPCTVGILTFNSAGSLRKCLESVVRFDEVIICDGGSTDETLSIAREFNCKIIAQDKKYKYPNNKIADFSGVRNQTYDASSHEWFFYVDSDEYVSSELVEEIAQIIRTDSADAPKMYRNPRKFTIDDKIIDCASVYPNYHFRLFHRDHVKGFEKPVHERPKAEPGIKIGTLKNVTYVPTSVDYAEIRKKHDYYIQIERERFAHVKRYQKVLVGLNNLKFASKRVIKFVLTLLYCRGSRMPLKKEFIALEYLFNLSKLLIIDGIKGDYENNKN